MNEIFRATTAGGVPAATVLEVFDNTTTHLCHTTEFDTKVKSAGVFDVSTGPGSPEYSDASNYYLYLVMMHEAMHMLGLEEDDSTDNLTWVQVRPEPDC